MDEKWGLVENLKPVLSRYVTEVKWGSVSACPSSRDIDSGSLEVLF